MYLLTNIRPNYNICTLKKRKKKKKYIYIVSNTNTLFLSRFHIFVVCMHIFRSVRFIRRTSLTGSFNTSRSPYH